LNDDQAPAEIISNRGRTYLVAAELIIIQARYHYDG
jgi:hypothetical protein